jgi:GTP cyclohydrolase III
MRDGMHQIDLGVIIRLIMAILRKYWECVLQFLGEDNAGLAAKKLEARFKKVLDRRTGQDKQS